MNEYILGQSVKIVAESFLNGEVGEIVDMGFNKQRGYYYKVYIKHLDHITYKNETELVPIC